jgi:hypothetical protein
MLQSWNKATDGNGAAVRVLLLDFKKAFDLIDHHLLVEKLRLFDIPKWVLIKLDRGFSLWQKAKS